MVVQFVRDGPHQVLECDEIEYIVVLVEWRLDLGRGAVVVSVEPFTIVPLVGDKVRAAEDEIVFRNSNGEGFHVGESRSGVGFICL